MSVVLDVCNLEVSVHTPRGRSTLVDNVSLQVHMGEVVAIVGDSGSGKTMTTLALTNLFPRRMRVRVSGSVRYDGQELVGADESTLRRVRGSQIAFVPQDAARSLDPLQTVAAHLDEALRLTGSRSNRRSAIADLLARVGFPDPERVARLYPHELSGGMRQRTLIAGALAGTPKLLVADEPTSSLDVLAQAGLLDLIDELRRDLELACILVTHDFGVVARLADTVVVMEDGRLVEHGPTAQMLADPRHPATLRLIEAVPRIDGDIQPRLMAEHDNDRSLVHARDIRVTFDGRRRRHDHAAIDGVDLELTAGHAVGIVGPSGCGKTTLARVICGLQRDVDGIVWKAPELSERHAIQLVFQDPSAALDPRQTVGNSINEALQLNGIGAASERATRVDALFERVGLDPSLAHRRPNELSGGQRQRCVIARALVPNPAVLVLDEPVSSLDVSVRAELLALFRRLRRDGVALLMISHDLAMVANLVDVVHVMCDGRIIESGTTTDIFEHPRESLTQRLVNAARSVESIRSSPPFPARSNECNDHQSPT